MTYPKLLTHLKQLKMSEEILQKSHLKHICDLARKQGSDRGKSKSWIWGRAVGSSDCFDHHSELCSLELLVWWLHGALDIGHKDYGLQGGEVKRDQ